MAVMIRLALVLMLSLSAFAPAAAQFLAEDRVESPFFNNSLYFAGPGGYQEVLYQDITSGALIRQHINPAVLKAVAG